MSTATATPESLALRELLRSRQDEIQTVLDAYHAVNLFVFGSVARGEAGPVGDIDLLVDLFPDDRHGELLRGAANHLSTSITEAHPEFDWAAVVEMRNIIVHEYFGIDSEIVVTTFERDLAPLASAL